MQLHCSTGLTGVKSRGDWGGSERASEICQEGKFCHRYTQDSGLLNKDVICSHSVGQKRLKFMFSLHFNFPLRGKSACTEDFCPSASPSMHICVQGYFNQMLPRPPCAEVTALSSHAWDSEKRNWCAWEQKCSSEPQICCSTRCLHSGAGEALSKAAQLEVRVPLDRWFQLLGCSSGRGAASLHLVEKKKKTQTLLCPLYLSTSQWRRNGELRYGEDPDLPTKASGWRLWLSSSPFLKQQSSGLLQGPFDPQTFSSPSPARQPGGGQTLSLAGCTQRLCLSCPLTSDHTTGIGSGCN